MSEGERGNALSIVRVCIPRLARASAARRAALARDAVDAEAKDAQGFEPAFPVHCEVSDIRFSDDGTQACMVQTNQLVIDVERVVWTAEHGQATKLWHKQADGTWKCTVYAWGDSGVSSLGGD